MILYNKIDRRVLKLKLMQENFERKTLSFYRFVAVEDPQQYRDELFLKLSEMKVFGRIYVAKEGINAQISVPLPDYDRFKNYIYQHPYTQDVLLNEAVEDNGKSFYKLKILVKYKILFFFKEKWMRCNKFNSMFFG